MEQIPVGAFVCAYTGEIVTRGLADIRGSYYDSLGSSYLFDMNDVWDTKEENEFESEVDQAFQN